MSAYPLDLHTTSVNVPSRAAKRLRIFNAVMGVLHRRSSTS
ncbi:MAG: hypothetical protein ABIS84_11940 [Arachnia sp.]